MNYKRGESKMKNLAFKRLTKLSVIFIIILLFPLSGFSQKTIHVSFDYSGEEDIASLSWNDGGLRRHTTVDLRHLQINDAKLEFRYLNIDLLSDTSHTTNANFHVEVDGITVSSYNDVFNYLFKMDTVDITPHVVGKDSVVISFVNDWSFTDNGIGIGFIKLIINHTTSIDQKDNVIITKNISLDQNYPNPFNPETTIRFSIPNSSHTKLVIYNAIGEQVKLLLDSFVNAGAKSIKWDGTDNKGNKLPSGLYFYKLQSGKFSDFRQMLLIE
jgi:hypothetical protein